MIGSGRSRVTVVGLGLMGGSLAASLESSGACYHVRGVSRRQWSIDRAEQLGWIDEGTSDLRKGVHGADIVVLATPVRTIVGLVGRIGPWLSTDCLLMDLGSTKRDVVVAMEDLPPAVQPVGGHPMCGKALSGLDAAEPGLYQGATFILTPLARTSAAALESAQRLVRAVGAYPLIVEAGRHDLLVGAVSHLPYCAAAALMQTVEDVGAEDEQVWELVASGFLDTSRLAASEVTMMRDILLTNRTVVTDLLRRYQGWINRLLAVLGAEDEAELERMMQGPSRRRRALFGSKNLEDVAPDG
jgi:prephenate dehydrogenase